MRTPLRPWFVALSACLGLQADAWGEFRFDEIEPRSFEYNDEWFMNIFDYRERITLRWRWDDGWNQAAVGYRISAGSVRSKDLYVDQQARVRLPFADVLGGEYRFIEGEDYDARFRRNEVDVLFRVLRPAYRLPLTQTLGRTPPPDGLFFGGTGVLDAEKEFADVGLVAGWRDEVVSLRLDAIGVDFFFNKKNSQDAEYTSSGPWTLKASGAVRLLGGDLRLGAWVVNDLPLRLELPAQDGGTDFRYRQLRAGLRAAYQPRNDLRFDLEAWGEHTEKSRRTGDLDPSKAYELERWALQGFAQMELDVAPLLESASHHADTVIVSAHVHLLDEVTRRPLDPADKLTIRRGEGYGQLGYVLSIPSPGEGYRFGIKLAALMGGASLREVDADQHDVGQKLLAKLSGGFEAIWRDGDAYAFLQFTWRADDQSFGGGNAQVAMRF